MLDRRLLLAGSAATLAAAALPAGAAPPPQRSGPHTPAGTACALGDVEVTALLDGNMQGSNAFIRNFFPDATPEEIAPLRERAFFVEQGLHQPVGAYVLNTGRNLVMIDCGGHASFIPTTGRTLESLRAAGYTPEQVDTVLLTHIHPEHALGLSYDGTTRNFPNAEVVVSDADHALLDRPGDGIARARRAPLHRGGAPRHPPLWRAHAPLPARSRGGSAARHRQHARPWPHAGACLLPHHLAEPVDADLGRHCASDGDPTRPSALAGGGGCRSRTGVESRLRTLTFLAEERMLAGGVHVPWPSFGRVIRDGEGFLWVPRPLQFA